MTVGIGLLVFVQIRYIEKAFKLSSALMKENYSIVYDKVQPPHIAFM